MRVFFDTNVLVAALVHEAGTAAAVRFLQAHAQQPLLISAWMSTELASALALLVRRSACKTCRWQPTIARPLPRAIGLRIGRAVDR